MKTAFSHPPGFYCARTSESDASIPPETLRVYVARLEAYDIENGDSAMDNVEFGLLPAMATDNPQIAKALVDLHTVLESNLAMLKEEAAKPPR